MKSYLSLAVIRRALVVGLLAASGLTAASPARAGLTFDLYLYTADQSYVFYTPLATNTAPPDAPLGTYFIYSPQQPTNGSWRQYELTTNGFSPSVSGGEASYPDLGSALQAITNGFWTIVVTNATATNRYQFTVTAPTMSSNLLPLSTVTFPAGGATQVTNQPAFSWQGPTNWLVQDFVEVYQLDASSQFSFFQTAAVPNSQTSWTIPVPIPPGTNTTFLVRATTNYDAPLFVASPPTNGNGQPIAGWVSTSTLESGASVNFMTAAPPPPPPPPTGHRLIAHYAFDASGNLGMDSSSNGNDMTGASWWGTQEQFSTNTAAGAGAVRFFGTSSLTPNGSVLSNWDSVLVGSFTISGWVLTTNTVGNDGDDAISGATIFWAYNDQGGTNDTIPLALTGSKAAFSTRDHLGSTTTLHSLTSVNDSRYHLLTVTRHGATGEKKIYVDGRFEASEIGTTEPLDGNDYYLSLGGTTMSSYTGLLDDVQMYLGVLSADEVAALYANPGSAAPDVAAGGLMAHYTFDNGAHLGADSSGNGYDMNFSGGWNGGGTLGTNLAVAGAGAVSFYRAGSDPNSGGFLGWNPMPGNLLAVVASDFTVSLWVKTTDNFGNQGDFAFNGAGVVAADVPGLASDLVPMALTGGQVAFNTGNTNAGSDDTLNSTATVNDGAWHHLVVTRQRATGEKTIYIDGVLDTVGSSTTNLLSDPRMLTIGAIADASQTDPNLGGYYNGYAGLLDDLQIYNRALASNEVAYLYQHPGAVLTNTASPPPYPVDVSLQLTFVRTHDPNFGEAYYAAVNFNSVNPAPTTTNLVSSPNEYFEATTDPTGGGGSSRLLTSLGEVLNECTNGSWQIRINSGSPTQQVYSFQVSVAGLDTNLLAPVIVYQPANGAVNVAANPAFHWTGPTNYSTLVVDLLSGPYASLPVTATNWPSAPALGYGPNRFDVNYTSNNFPGVTFTMPVDSSGNPLRTWTTEADLSTIAFNHFTVGAPAPLPVLLTNVTLADGNLEFAFQTQAGRPHTVQAATNLLGGWVDLTNFTGDGALWQFNFPATNPPLRFFRVRTN